jgi:3-phytase
MNYQKRKNMVMVNKMFSVFTSGLIIALVIISWDTGNAVEKNQSKELIRIAQFNIWEMSTEKLTELDKNGVGANEQLVAAAEIIRKINPDVLVINEIDHDIEATIDGEDYSLNARRFSDTYLNKGDNPVDYPFIFAAECNTGFLTGKDLDNNGKIATEADRGSRDHGGDCYGYGAYPGQYSMAIFSRYPFQSDKIRTFQKFLWKNLPENLIPTDWYSPDEIDIFRLSSKSHWDVPVLLGEKMIHLLVSHPTPPVFDGDEDRNGRRNYDEIRMWVHYINNDLVITDDKGIRGGLAEDKSFVIVGDLNAAPQGDKLETGQRSIDQLLNHERVQDCGKLLVSEGALNGQEPGPPKHIERRTTGWKGRGLRIDHLLPSKDLQPVSGGVFWPDPASDPKGAAMAKKASDHRMIWLDFEGLK